MYKGVKNGIILMEVIKYIKNFNKEKCYDKLQ